MLHSIACAFQACNAFSPGDTVIVKISARSAANHELEQSSVLRRPRFFFFQLDRVKTEEGRPFILYFTFCICISISPHHVLSIKPNSKHRLQIK